MYRKIINNGISLISNINEAKRIQLLRIYCLIWVHISLTFIILDHIFKPPFKNIDTLLHSCCLISIGIIFLLLYFKKYFAAKILLIIQCFGMFSSITFILLEATYSIFYFTLIPIVALSLFKKNTIAYLTLVLGICIAIFHKETPEILSDASIHVDLFKAPIMITMFFGLFAIFSYFKKLNLKNEKLLALERDKALSDKVIIENQAQKLKKLNEFKSHFFVNLSHEIRTPITLIKGYTSQINVIKDETNLHKLSVVKNQIQQIEGIINNILDLSKLDDNKLNLNRTDIEIVSFLNKQYADFKMLFENKKIAFHLNNNTTDLTVRMDINLISKSITNLLSNALKFTSKNGVVAINSYVEDTIGDLIIEIIDNGIGIPKEDLNKIFERFYQSKNDITKSQ